MSKEFKLTAWYFFLLILIVGINVILANYLFEFSGVFKNTFPDLLANWDGNYFLEIAKSGYLKDILYVFFPLYPILIKVVTNLLPVTFLQAGLLINLAATFFSFYFLIKLLKFDLEEKLIKEVLLLLLIFPTSFFLLTTYSESLFICLTVLSFYFARKKLFFWATIFALLSATTRLAGVAVILALWVEVVHQGNLRKNWFVFLAPAGLFVYCYFLFIQTGDPFYFLSVESSIWQRSLAIPGSNIFVSLNQLIKEGITKVNFGSWLDWLFLILGLGLALRAWRILRHSYAIFCLASIALPLVTNSLTSVPRFLLAIFPFFILIGLITQKHERVKLIVTMVSVTLLSVFIVRFTLGFWVS